MNLFLLIVIALMAFVATSCIVYICAKRANVGRAVLSVLFAAVTVFSTATVAFAQNSDNGAAADTDVRQVGETKSLAMVYGFVAAGDYDQAEKILTGYESSTAYSGDYALCHARIYGLRGRYIAAKKLYEKSGYNLSRGDVAEEYATVCECLLDSAIDRILYENSDDYVPPVENADSVIQTADKARGELSDVILGGIESYFDNDDGSDKFADAAKFIAEVNELYDNYIRTGRFDSEAVTDLLSDAKRLVKKEEAIAGESVFRIARLKLYVLTEDFDKLCENVDDNADYHELLVVAELYTNGYIKERDFADEYGEDRIDMYQKVYDQLEKVYERVYEDKDKNERKAADALLDDVEDKIEHPALAKMEDTLLGYANDIYTEDRTKIYLQMAKYENQKGDSVKTNEHLTSALNTVTDCTDDVYMNAMCELISVINKKDDPNGLRNIAQYVNQVSDNSTTIQLANKLKEKNPEADNGSDGGDVSFDDIVSDYISKKRTSLNILNVDSSDFSNVTFQIGVDSEIAYSAEQIKELLKITDCGVEITDFTVKEVSYAKTNIVLVCDTSGSMSGSPINDLKNAVTMFLENKNKKENIGLITFASNVTGRYGLDTGVSALKEIVNSIRANGGTNIYGAMLSATEMATAEADALNVIILLSDGQDGSNTSLIQQNIVNPCLANNTIIYSLGLGSGVNSSVLDAYASPTGGSYLHVVNSTTLSTFYEYLHSMVLNRYEITFTAKDTLRYDRTLRIESKEDELAYDVAKYTVGEESGDEGDTGSGSGDWNSSVVYKNKYVSGLDTRYLYDTNKVQKVYLKGKNFESGDSIAVTLKGKLDYDIKASFISDCEYELAIPANIMDGTYDMEVTINGNTGYFAKELTVGGDIKTVEFGPYKFVSTSVREEGNKTILSGYVCMNGWLCFKGDVELSGNLTSDQRIYLTDRSGSYVKFDKAAVTGLAKNIVEQGKTLEIEALGSIAIYNVNEDHYSEDYTVSGVTLNTVNINDVATLKNASVYLYPTFIRATYTNFNTNFPMQKQLFKNGLGLDLFNFSANGRYIISAKSAAMKAEYGYDIDAVNPSYNWYNMMSMPIEVAPKETKFTIDTMEGIYGIRFMVKLAFLGDDGLGFDIAWNDKFQLDKAKFMTDMELTKIISGVPVTFTDFEVGAEDMAGAPLKDWMLMGSTKIEVADVTDVLKGIKKLDKLFKDTPVFVFDNTSVQFSFGQCYFKLGTTAKFLGAFELGNLSIEAGKLKYTNTMLGMHSVDATGLVANVHWDVTVPLADLTIDAEANGQVSLTDKFIGAHVNGNFDFTVKLWLFQPNVKLAGDVVIGVYAERDGDYVLTIRGRGFAGTKKAGICLDFREGRWPQLNTKYY